MSYDVIVVGAGHAGIEASLAAARHWQFEPARRGGKRLSFAVGLPQLFKDLTSFLF